MAEPAVPKAMPLIYLIACEPSGDQIGALLMAALKRETNGYVRFAGLGGSLMAGEGLVSLFDTRELALFGIFEVLPKIGMVRARVRQTVDDILTVQPDVLVTIDSWGFTGRIHERLTQIKSPIRRVRYVAPQVWAWRAGRARQLARWIDHLMTLLPFEQTFFTQAGLAATWVGHPVLECGAERGDAQRFRGRHNVPADSTVLTVLPGSRRSEVTRLLPVFRETVARLAAEIPRLHVAMPTVETVADVVAQAVKSWPVPVTVVGTAQDRYDVFAASNAALAASGTVSLELALARVPHVIAYRVNGLSALAFKFLATTRFVNLVNVLLGREAVPERLQGMCTPGNLTRDVNQLLNDENVRARQQSDFAEALARLAPQGALPSRMAAQTVLKVAAGSK